MGACAAAGSCPVGDDPQTPGAKELQVLRCTASSAGTFQLTFRDFTTSPLSVTSTATDIAAALAALPSVGVDCDTTCSNGGPTITVEFDDGKTAACTCVLGAREGALVCVPEGACSAHVAHERPISDAAAVPQRLSGHGLARDVQDGPGGPAGNQAHCV